jgi:hypothetical protein
MGIIMLQNHEFFAGVNLNSELFLQLSLKCLKDCFASLHFPAWDLPISCIGLTGWALT